MADVTDVTKTLKEAAYVAVGLGVIGFQRAQVRRQELTKQFAGQRKEFETQLGEVRTQLTEAAKSIQAKVAPVLDEVEGKLPEPAKDLVHQARGQLRKTLNLGDRAAA